MGLNIWGKIYDAELVFLLNLLEKIFKKIWILGEKQLFAKSEGTIIQMLYLYL